jgi:CRISPR-associated exonuclease Cas4
MNLKENNLLNDYLMLSGIQHFVFCKRQCGLIHLEQVWNENTLTLEGEALHERVDKPQSESRPGIKLERSLPIKSEQLKLFGRADMVEFHMQGDKWNPFPVEYKRGKPKQGLEDKIQLCAQAICLEETFNCTISKGALFYGKEKRRLEVAFDNELRQFTIQAAEGFHLMMRSNSLPPTEFGPKCKNCSLLEICLPESQGININEYLSNIAE